MKWKKDKEGEKIRGIEKEKKSILSEELIPLHPYV